MPRSRELTVSCVTLLWCHVPHAASSSCATRAKGPEELSLHPGEAENLCCPCFPEGRGHGVIFPRSHRGSGSVTTSSVSPALLMVWPQGHQGTQARSPPWEGNHSQAGMEAPGSVRFGPRACGSGFKIIPVMRD